MKLSEHDTYDASQMWQIIVVLGHLAEGGLLSYGLMGSGGPQSASGFSALGEVAPGC